MPIIYEVNVLVKEESSDKYLKWLIPHAKEMHSTIAGLHSHTISRNTTVSRDTIPSHAERIVFAAEGASSSADDDDEGKNSDKKEEPQTTTAKYHQFVISYRIGKRKDLDEYLSERASLMRASALEAFTAEEMASLIFWRRILEVIEIVEPSTTTSE